MAGRMNLLCPMPGCHLENVGRDGAGGLVISARGAARAGRCPGCPRPSRSVHSRYRRRLADLPSFAATTTVTLQVRPFYCRNPSCARRTFAEPLPDLVRPRARRTNRLSQAQSRIGVALGGNGGARLTAHLSMPASAATVLRLVKALPMSTLEAPRRIGVDDWALRKGSTYGTIIVDLERWLQTARQVCHKAMRRRSRPELRRSGSALGSADWCAGRGA